MLVKRGQLITLYLMLESAARFTVDFWRDDRGDLFSVTFLGDNLGNISQPQLWNGVFFLIALGLFLTVTIMQPRADYRVEVL